jgi:hypothetical protein
MSIYNKIKAQMIKAGIEEPDQFLVKPGTKLPEPREMATSNISVLVEFWLHPVRDVMCCKVAGNVLEISRKDLEENNYAPFFDAMYEALNGVLDMAPNAADIGKAFAPLQAKGQELAPDLIFEEEEEDGAVKKAVA